VIDANGHARRDKHGLQRLHPTPAARIAAVAE